MCYFWTFSRKHSSYLHSITNSGLILGGKNSSKRDRRYSSRLWILWTKNHKDRHMFDLEAPRLVQSMHKAWMKHQKTAYWVDINFASKKRLKFSQSDRTPSSFWVTCTIWLKFWVPSCHPCTCAFLLEFTSLIFHFDLSFPVFFFSSLLHFEQHTELDNLITMQHNLRTSAKGSDDAHNVHTSLKLWAQLHGLQWAQRLIGFLLPHFPVIGPGHRWRYARLAARWNTPRTCRLPQSGRRVSQSVVIVCRVQWNRETWGARWSKCTDKDFIWRTETNEYRRILQ